MSLSAVVCFCPSITLSVPVMKTLIHQTKQQSGRLAALLQIYRNTNSKLVTNTNSKTVETFRKKNVCGNCPDSFRLMQCTAATSRTVHT